MYLNPDYALRTLSETPYLLPFGAGIALFRPQLQLDETGVFIWNALKKTEQLSELTLEETAVRLTELICREYELPASEMPDVKKDILSFLETLLKQNILTEDRYLHRKQEPLPKCAFPFSSFPRGNSPALTISIAGIEIELYGERPLFSKTLDSFEVSGSRSDAASSERLRFYFTREQKPQSVPEGTPLINHPDLQVFAFENGYHLRRPSSRGINHIFLPKDGSDVYFYLTEETGGTMRYDVFHSIRLVFSYFAMLRGYYLIHSVSISYRDKAWLFSASSGTGKSTHAGLWTKLYEKEVHILNGDVNLITVNDGIPMVYGIPWNGTSGIYSTDCVPLGGIAFLQRAEADFIRELPEDKKQLSLLQRLISPNWTEELLEREILFSNELVPKIFMTELHCTPEPSAAKVMRRAIDEWLSL